MANTCNSKTNCTILPNFKLKILYMSLLLISKLGQVSIRNKLGIGIAGDIVFPIMRVWIGSDFRLYDGSDLTT